MSGETASRAATLTLCASAHFHASAVRPTGPPRRAARPGKQAGRLISPWVTVAAHRCSHTPLPSPPIASPAGRPRAGAPPRRALRAAHAPPDAQPAPRLCGARLGSPTPRPCPVRLPALRGAGELRGGVPARTASSAAAWGLPGRRPALRTAQARLEMGWGRETPRPAHALSVCLPRPPHCSAGAPSSGRGRLPPTKQRWRRCWCRRRSAPPLPPLRSH